MLRLDAPHPRRRQGQGAALPRQRAHDDGDDRLKPAPFEYAAPASLDEAVELLGRHGDEAKAIAGGQSLGPLLNLRLASPRVLVDLNRLPGLDGVEVEEDGALAVGALARQRALERDARVARSCPLLTEALPLVGHVATRNRATLGGSLAHADPAAELPAVVTALGAEIRVRGRAGERTVAPGELFVMPLVTSLAPDELVVSVRFPPLRPRTGCAWLELAERHGDFALAGVAALVSLDEAGSCREARLALAGVGPAPVDARAAARTLEGREPNADAIAEAAERAAEACEPASDAHASAAYRRRLVRVLAGRALAAAAARAREDGDGG